MSDKNSWRNWAWFNRDQVTPTQAELSTRTALRTWGRSAVDFLYPPQCRLCAADLGDEDAAHADFCSACLGDLLETAGATCARCGAGIGPYVDPATGCLHCRGDSFAFETVLRLGVYDNRLRDAVLQSKLRGGDRLLAGLAELVWRRNSQALQNLGIDVVVPVPLYFWQGLLRPHNPAAVLAEVWGKRLNAPSATHILRKIRWTEAQARLNPTQRRVNVQNAFAVAKGTLPAGATVLLADDVLTTGTTANEAARVLKRAGAARVVVAVLARGLGRR